MGKKYRWLGEVFDTLDEVHNYARNLSLDTISDKCATAKAIAMQEYRTAKTTDGLDVGATFARASNASRDQLGRSREAKTYMIGAIGEGQSRVIVDRLK